MTPDPARRKTFVVLRNTFFGLAITAALCCLIAIWSTSDKWAQTSILFAVLAAIPAAAITMKWLDDELD